MHCTACYHAVTARRWCKLHAFCSVVPVLEETSAFMFELHIKVTIHSIKKHRIHILRMQVRANIPSTNYGGHMKITCPVARTCLHPRAFSPF